MTLLKTDAVTEALHKAVAEKGGDYVYPWHEVQCSYTEPGEREEGSVAPSCIVGYVIDAIDHDALERIAVYEEREGESLGVGELFDVDVDFQDETLLVALEAAQRVQDRGAPWKYSQIVYDRVIARGPDCGSVEDAVDQALDQWKAER